MLKTLLKKQFAEIFKSWFVKRKTGEGRSKAGIVGLACVFALLMAYLLAVFFFMDYWLGQAFFPAGMGWLYFAMAGFLSILFGTLGSVFNTYAGMYLAKDNDFLISMPIPPRTILASRLCGVYLMGLLYSGAVWLPALLCWWIFGSPTVLSVVFGVLLLFVIGFFVAVLTCLLGWLVALIASRLKNRSFLIVLISLVFFGLYYSVCFRFSEIIQSIILHSDKVGAWIKVWGNLIYQLGLAAMGETVPMLIFTGITAALTALGVFVLSKTFLRLATGTAGGKKAVYREHKARREGVAQALLSRELKHFTSSATYMLNTGLGIVMLPAVGVLALVNRGRLDTLQLMLGATAPQVLPYIPLAAAAGVCAMLAVNAISTPSVSLEGRSLWLLQSLPVTPAQALQAKLHLHVLLNLLPALVTPVLLSLALRLDAGSTVLLLVLAVVFTWFNGLLGLKIGIKRPNFNWTNETTPIKQSVNPLLVWLAGTALALAIPGGYFLLGLLHAQIDVRWYLGLWALLLAGLSLLEQRWLSTRGAQRFAEL